MIIFSEVRRCCLALSLAVLCFGQTATSIRSASQQLKNWLAAYDGSDWNAYLSFVQKNFASPPEPMLRDHAFRDLTGGFALQKIEAETPEKVTAVIQEQNTELLSRIVVEVETAEPHRILKLQPQPIPPSHLSENDLIGHTRQLLERMTLADKFAGDVLIAKDGRIVFSQAYGLADREHRTPNTLHSRFGMASVGKMFTAVAILQLERAGKIKIDDPVGKYLTDYPNRQVASTVTIRELLNHTSGMGDIFGPEWNEHVHELHSHDDYIRLFGSRPPHFEPGSRLEYSNYGYVILGALIERVSGQNYYDYVRNHIYIPAGMTSTDMPEPGDKPVRDLSLGYTRRGGETWHTSSGAEQARGTASGGGYTTLEDLLRFANALQDNKLLDAEGTKLLTTGDITTRPGPHYLYGFEVNTWNGVRCFGKPGGGPGTDNNFNICLDAGYVVAVFANMDPPAGQRISFYILNRLPESRRP